MYNVAICDDDELICSQFENVLEEYISIGKIELETFYSGEELMKFLEEGYHFDVIYLDIDLISISGIDIGNVIRNRFNDNNMHIVYISGKQDYAMKLFESRPLNFLIKPLATERILGTLEKAMNLSLSGKMCFEVKNGSKTTRIPFNQIAYFESRNRKIITHTCNNEYEMYGKLSQIEISLPLRFVRIHQSYIVNADFVTKWKPTEVNLFKSDVLPVSTSYKKNICNVLLENE